MANFRSDLFWGELYPAFLVHKFNILHQLFCRFFRRFQVGSSKDHDADWGVTVIRSTDHSLVFQPASHNNLTQRGLGRNTHLERSKSSMATHPDSIHA